MPWNPFVKRVKQKKVGEKSTAKTPNEHYNAVIAPDEYATRFTGERTLEDRASDTMENVKGDSHLGAKAMGWIINEVEYKTNYLLKYPLNDDAATRAEI